ncbi:MAG TPA: hypothetical protein VNZ86_04225, partial [Bacteroidia bacterium]|nr:hypothetical protein [Bacteroidia bacterium]
YKIPALFFLLLLPCVYHAQALDQNPPEAFSTDPVFLKQYITSNKIRNIHAGISYKRDNEAIQDKGLCKNWEFDTDGLLKRYYVTSVKGFVNHDVEHPAVYRRGRKVRAAWTSQEASYLYDTTFISYTYNSAKQLILKRTRDGDYYNAVYYEYDLDGKLKKQSVFRETNASDNRNTFRLGVQNLLSAEEFRYEKSAPGQIKRKHLNDEGKVYKQAIQNIDSLGRVNEENTSYTVSWMRASAHYRYDKKGRLIQKALTSNENGDESSRTEYKYTGDTFLLDVEQRYQGDVFQQELNYIYDRQSHLLSSYFIREELNKAIVLVRLSYDYY